MCNNKQYLALRLPNAGSKASHFFFISHLIQICNTYYKQFTTNRNCYSSSMFWFSFARYVHFNWHVQTSMRINWIVGNDSIGCILCDGAGVAPWLISARNVLVSMICVPYINILYLPKCTIFDWQTHLM